MISFEDQHLELPEDSGGDDDEAGGTGSSNLTEKTTVLKEDQTTLNKELQKAKEQEACLIIIRGSPQGHRFFLTQDEMTIGRDPTADISVSDHGISRKHAKVRKAGGKVYIQDLGSANGTKVNDRKLPKGDEVTLAKEDMIKLGNSIFKFLPAGELEILFYGNLDLAAHTDSLTRVYNKGYLMEALEAEFKRAKALHQDFTVLFFDIDHFKKVNDTYGHDAGDYVLKEFTALIRAGFLRPKDVFARYGGEEFVVLLSNTDGKAAAEMGEKIRVAIESHAFVYEGNRIPITSSLGIAELRAGIESAQTLLKNSDKALYQAKQTGRNKVVVAG